MEKEWGEESEEGGENKGQWRVKEIIGTKQRGDDSQN